MTRDHAIRAAVRESYDEIAGVYEKRWRKYVRRSVAETLRRVDVRPGDSLLDVGCGTGAFLEAMRGMRAAGVDLSIGMLRRARSRLGAGVALYAADAERLPFADGRFDVVVSLSSFHFWSNPAAALAEIRRVLRPGGRLMLTDWCDDFLACRVCDLYLKWRDPAHRRIFGAGSCEELLRGAGLSIDRIDRYKISWMWGLMTAVAEKPR